MARILVADDSADMRDLLGALLSGEGHDVTVATNGAAAIAAIRSQSPDLLVLDVMMPQVDGFSVLREMKAAGNEVKTLVLTAKASESDIVTGYKLGADRYLTKPFSPDELIETVANLLRASREDLRGRSQEELARAQLLERLESLFS